jgi:peptidoglycan/LPS O-acetylase OafA/YrhL
MIKLSTNKNEDYIPQLDTLRTIAVLLVIVSHWISSDNIINFFPNGMMGVDLFFVLSGFLITGILLRAKTKAEKSNKSKSKTIISFFTRRALRIFPIYLIVITILLIAGFGLVKTNPGFFYTYTHNFLYHSVNMWPGYISHLWSLAVEEQFYLIWPFILLFIPNKYILKTLIFIIVLGFSSHLMLDIFLPNNQLNSVLLPTCLYAFGFGGLLAYLQIIKSEVLNTIFSKIIIGITLLLFTFYTFNIIEFYKEIFERFLFSIISMYAIHYTCQMQGVILKIFTNKLTVYLGKISYGLYLFHPLIGFIYNDIHLFLKKTNINIPFTDITFFPNIEFPVLRMFFLSLLLIAISSFSWYLIEKPINNLKKYFKYN